MTKLIEALIALAEAGTEYLKSKTGPITMPQDGNAAPAPAAAPKKPRAAKEKAPEAPAPAPQPQAPAPAPAAQPQGNPDPLADLMGSANAAFPQPQAPAPAAAPVLTPEQSILEMKKAAFGVVKAFPAVTQNGAGGAPSTEGEDKLRALLGGTFKVAKLMDLTHENRLLFIASAQNIVAGAK